MPSAVNSRTDSACIAADSACMNGISMKTRRSGGRKL